MEKILSSTTYLCAGGGGEEGVLYILYIGQFRGLNMCWRENMHKIRNEDIDKSYKSYFICFCCMTHNMAKKMNFVKLRHFGQFLGLNMHRRENMHKIKNQDICKGYKSYFMYFCCMTHNKANKFNFDEFPCKAVKRAQYWNKIFGPSLAPSPLLI